MDPGEIEVEGVLLAIAGAGGKGEGGRGGRGEGGKRI